MNDRIRKHCRNTLRSQSTGIGKSRHTHSSPAVKIASCSAEATERLQRLAFRIVVCIRHRRIPGLCNVDDAVVEFVEFEDLTAIMNP